MITQYDIIDEIRKAIDDALIGGTGTAGKFMTDNQILAFVLKNALAENVYQFNRLTHGYYSWFGFGYFFNPYFTESDYCDYLFNASGSIIVTEGNESPEVGSETREQIDVLACRVNFNRVVADCFIYMANTESKIMSQSGDMGSISPNTIRQELMAQATHWSQKEWMEN